MAEQDDEALGGPRRTSRWVAFAGAAVALTFAGRAGLNAWRAREATVALASSHACLFGGPLAKSDAPDLMAEHPSGRLHRIALGSPPADWPKRCEPYVRHYLEAREALDAPVSSMYDVESLDVSLIEGTPYDFDAFWEQNARPDVAVPAGVPVAPPAVEAADDRTPALLPGASLIGARSDGAPAKAVNLWIDGHLCSAETALGELECKAPDLKVGALVPGEPGSRLLTSSSDAWFTATSPIVRVDGVRFCAIPERSCVAFGLADGSALWITHALDPGNVPLDRFTLGRGTSGAEPTVDAKLAVPFTSTVRLLGENVFVIDHGNDHGKDERLRLSRRAIHGTTLYPAEDWGEIPDALLNACYVKSGLVIHGGAWVAFVDGAHVVRRFEIPRATADASVERVVGCGADDFTVTDVSSSGDVLGGVVHSVRCTSDGCGPVESAKLHDVLGAAPAPFLPRKAGDVHATQLGGKVLLLWRSERRGVRFRLATTAGLASAPDHILYDDRLAAGAPFEMSTLQDEVVILPRHDGVMVLVQSMDSVTGGVKALRIGPDGAVVVPS